MFTESTKARTASSLARRAFILSKKLSLTRKGCLSTGRNVELFSKAY